MSTLIAWIKLLSIVEKIMDSIYSPQRKLSASKAVELNEELDAWAVGASEIFKRAENLLSGTTNLFTVLLVSGSRFQDTTVLTNGCTSGITQVGSS